MAWKSWPFHLGLLSARVLRCIPAHLTPAQAHQTKALAAFPKHLSQSSAPAWWLTTIYSSSSGDHHPLLSSVCTVYRHSTNTQYNMDPALYSSQQTHHTLAEGGDTQERPMITGAWWERKWSQGVTGIRGGQGRGGDWEGGRNTLERWWRLLSHLPRLSSREAPIEIDHRPPRWLHKPGSCERVLMNYHDPCNNHALCSRILNAKGKAHSKPAGMHVQRDPAFFSSHLGYLVTLLLKMLLSTSKRA